MGTSLAGKVSGEYERASGSAESYAGGGWGGEGSIGLGRYVDGYGPTRRVGPLLLVALRWLG